MVPDRNSVRQARDRRETGRDRRETGRDRRETGRDRRETGRDRRETGPRRERWARRGTDRPPQDRVQRLGLGLSGLGNSL